MPSLEMFEAHCRQDPTYRERVLPSAITARVSVELASTFGWDRYVGPGGQALGMTTFGASAPLKELQKKFGFTVEHVVAAARQQLARAEVVMKVGILGCGFVGATTAYALVMRGVGREIVLVDKNRDRAEAEADDIRHAVPFAHPLDVRAGDYADLKGCRAVVICAGVGQKPGETRLQLLRRNAAVFAEVVPRIVAVTPDAVLIVATDPVDVMTHLTARYAASCGIPATRVLGSGTTLDTARFRSLLGAHCGVDPQHVHAYVIGEHGDSEVLTWSLATIGGMPLEAFAQLRELDLTEAVRANIDGRVRRAAYTIIGGKGATYYGIGSALARILSVVLHKQRAILTVCSPTADVAGVRDVTVALPRLVGRQGVVETFPLPLNPEETSQLHASAAVIRQALDELATG